MSTLITARKYPWCSNGAKDFLKGYLRTPPRSLFTMTAWTSFSTSIVRSSSSVSCPKAVILTSNIIRIIPSTSQDGNLTAAGASLYCHLPAKGVPTLYPENVSCQEHHPPTKDKLPRKLHLRSGVKSWCRDVEWSTHSSLCKERLPAEAIPSGPEIASKDFRNQAIMPLDVVCGEARFAQEPQECQECSRSPRPLII